MKFFFEPHNKKTHSQHFKADISTSWNTIGLQINSSDVLKPQTQTEEPARKRKVLVYKEWFVISQITLHFTLTQESFYVL